MFVERTSLYCCIIIYGLLPVLVSVVLYTQYQTLVLSTLYATDMWTLLLDTCH